LVLASKFRRYKMQRGKNPPAPATIKHIAIESGVSIASVSRALNDEEGVGMETRKRILETSKRLNYHPNLQARGLVSKKPNAIGIIIPGRRNSRSQVHIIQRF